MTNRQRNTARAGYLLGGALGLVRFAGAQTMQDLMLASSLVLAELSIVWLVEKKAAEREAALAHRDAGERLRSQQQSRAQSTSEELTRRQQRLDETKDETRKIENACYHDHLMSDAKALNNIAIYAVRNGYYAGVAKIENMLGGGRPPADEGGKAA